MKILRLSAAIFTLTLAGSCAFALEPVPWNHKDYAAEFKYFQESEGFTRETWTALPPQEQEFQLREIRQPALDRQEEIKSYYAALVAKWDGAELRDYTAQTKEEQLKPVRLWLGGAKTAALEKKLALTRAMLAKAPSEGLDDADEAALAPYLTPQAISDLRGLKAAAVMQRQAAAASARPDASGTVLNSTAEKVSGSLSRQPGGNMSALFDGNSATGDVSGGVRLGDASLTGRGLPKEAPGAAAESARQPGNAARGTAPAHNTTAASTIKHTAPAPLPGAGAPPDGSKSTAWTSDAYGFTVTANGRTQTFREGKKAEAAIRQLPDGSISRVILYGHGSPGMQSVGGEAYEAGDAAAMFKGKMARGGVIQFSGCNTASIGDATLNPAVGLSMVARRLLYFSLPYFQDRADGVPAAEARDQWGKFWNADLARDTSLGVKGAIVCGYRTFGLVPGRLPGLTRLMGSQEATTPGYVAGKKACYQDGREVPEP